MSFSERAKIGVFMIGAERFRQLGTGAADGSYEERKAREAAAYLEAFGSYAEVICDGPVYSREQADRAVMRFYNEKVDCVVALFLSWAEDFAWIRFSTVMRSPQ